MAIRNALKSKTARLVGGTIAAYGLLRPVLEVVRWVLDVIGEGQTFGELWPSIRSLALFVYNAPPIWANAILVLVGGGLLVASRRPRVDLPSPNDGLALPVAKPRTAQEWTDYKRQQVPNRKFEYGELVMDGKDFLSCTFTHMHLYYDGTAPMSWTDCDFDEDTRRNIHTHNPGIAQFMENVRHLGLLREGTKFATTPLDQANAVPRIDSVGTPNAQIESNKRWRPLTGDELAAFTEALSEPYAPQRAHIEIVSTANGKLVADALLRVLTALKYEVKLLMNTDSRESAMEPQADGITLRYLPGPMISGVTGDCALRGLLRAGLVPIPEKFVDNRAYYSLVRIEIGDRTSESQRL